MNAIQKSVGEEPVIECQERTFVSSIIPGTEVIKLFSFSTEQEISTAHKN